MKFHKNTNKNKQTVQSYSCKSMPRCPPECWCLHHGWLNWSPAGNTVLRRFTTGPTRTLTPGMTETRQAGTARHEARSKREGRHHQRENTVCRVWIFSHLTQRTKGLFWPTRVLAADKLKRPFRWVLFCFCWAWMKCVLRSVSMAIKLVLVW